VHGSLVELLEEMLVNGFEIRAQISRVAFGGLIDFRDNQFQEQLNIVQRAVYFVN
jgi:hypothetical protein